MTATHASKPNDEQPSKPNKPSQLDDGKFHQRALSELEEAKANRLIVYAHATSGGEYQYNVSCDDGLGSLSGPIAKQMSERIGLCCAAFQNEAVSDIVLVAGHFMLRLMKANREKEQANELRD